MKYLIYLVTLLTFFGCGNSEKKETPSTSQNLEFIPETEKDMGLEVEKTISKNPEKIEPESCEGQSVDFLILEDERVQADFFSKLDSIRKIQYPDDDRKMSIMVDITPEYLNKFLTDLDQDTLMVKKGFDKEYHFDIAPQGYTDPKICMDRIEVGFDEEKCTFRLKVFNTFLVQADWCTESMVVYGFKIENGNLVDFWRQEAG